MTGIAAFDAQQSFDCQMQDTDVHDRTLQEWLRIDQSFRESCNPDPEARDSDSFVHVLQSQAETAAGRNTEVVRGAESELRAELKIVASIGAHM